MIKKYGCVLALGSALLVGACDEAGKPSGSLGTVVNGLGFKPAPGSALVFASAPAGPSARPVRYRDALAGLYLMPASAVPLDAKVDYYKVRPESGAKARAILTMGLVPGANYRILKTYHAQAAKDVADAEEDLEIRPVLQRAVEIVKERYPWLELTDDVATARARDASLTLVLDIRSRLGKPGGDPTAVQIELIAFDDSHKPVSRILTEGKVNAGGANGYNFQAAAKQALDALESKSASELD